MIGRVDVCVEMTQRAAGFYRSGFLGGPQSGHPHRGGFAGSDRGITKKKGREPIRLQVGVRPVGLEPTTRGLKGPVPTSGRNGEFFRGGRPGGRT
jgi:hypothetical protein